MISIYRKDPKNVGDWWSPPHRYFPEIKPEEEIDLISIKKSFQSENLVIVGGGGLGRTAFRPHLDNLRHSDKSYRLVAWGVGTDLDCSPEESKSMQGKISLLGNFFEGFDLVGTRVYDPLHPELWTPCASCMHPEIEYWRSKKASHDILIYSHKRHPITLKNTISFWKKNRNIIQLPKGLSYSYADNSGNNITEKLRSMADARIIITNSYHGVYWATLLERQVICIPFKSGLYSFKHSPKYIENEVTLDDLHTAPKYASALEECKNANTSFLKQVLDLQS